ncbi:MAG TPA: 6-hydroxymethylpterin diphosphokinase MptE-like protein [Tepidisphaeraceae bacterium]|nr:6-hydroxymethylpterin diphosphokinase MptE-like protein [Tepidisphaeraceae bacterium]
MTPSLPPEADDPSRRHVLAADAPLLKNLAALWAADPTLAADLEALHPTPSYPVETTKAGVPTVAVVPQTSGSAKSPARSIYLHSRYQPVEEAATLVEPLDVDSVFAFYVHGLGLGYHVEQLFARSSGEALLFVFEPDLRLIRTALEHRDLSKLIESRRVTFFTKHDKSDLFTRLTPHAALLSVGVGTLVHPPSLQVAGEFHRQVQAWLAEFESFTRTSINTLVLNSRRTAENVTRNIGWYVATPSLSRLADKHKGQPAIVVSAGPSLRKNIDLLRDAQDKAVIIAVQTTLKPLLEKGVSPHFVTSLDYHDICTRFFEKLPRTLRTELVAEPKAASAIFDLQPGPLSLLGNDFADSLLREMKPDKLRLPSGATVAHLAYYLAEHLGCDPIVFVGQDLGFSDGLCYAPGTSYDDVWRPELNRFCTVEMKQWEQIARERFILRRIPDHEGRPMYTEERLFSYLQQFERDFARSKAKIIDATEGGARKRGAERMKLAEVIGQYCTRPIGRSGDDYPGLRWDRVAGAIDCLRTRREEAARIEQLSNETLPLLEEIRDHVEDQPRVNRAISSIDALRARMNELGATYDLVTQLTQGTEMRRFKADRSLSASKQLDGPERQRRQVTRDVDNVRAVAEAAREFQCLMDEVIDRLVAQGGRAALPPVHPNFRQEAA